MAWIKKRGNTWFACWLDVAGKEVRKSTRVHVKPEARDVGMTARDLKKLAERTAESMEGAAKGGLTVELAVASVRAAATGGEFQGVTVGEYAKKWLASRSGEKSFGNMKAGVAALWRHVPTAKDVPLGRFTRAMGEDFVRRGLEECRGGTVSRWLGVLVTMFNRAVNERAIERNPLHGVRVPSAETRPNEREPFSRRELQVLLEKTPGEWPDMVAVCLLLGGLRIGECARLKWEHVDFDANLVAIRTRKTNRGMTKPMILPLKRILQRRREAGEKWSEYVFPFAKMRVDQCGGDSSKLSQDFSALVKKLGIKSTLRPEENAPKNAREWNPKTFHSLRTTATTFLLDVGCPAELVRHIVGHDDAEIERRHYYRPTEETQQNYIKKIGELLGLDG